MHDDDEETPAQKRKREYEAWDDEVRSARERGERDGRYGRYRENHSEEFAHEDARRLYEKARNERIEYDEKQERLFEERDAQDWKRHREWVDNHSIINWDGVEEWYYRQVAKYGATDPKTDAFMKVLMFTSIVAFCVLAYETRRPVWSGLVVCGFDCAIVLLAAFVGAWLDMRRRSHRSKSRSLRSTQPSPGLQAIRERVQAKEARKKQDEEEKRQAAVAASAPELTHIEQSQPLAQLSSTLSEMTKQALEEGGEERGAQSQQAVPDTQEAMTGTASETAPGAQASPGQLSVARSSADTSPIASALQGSIWTQVSGPGADAKPSPTIEFISGGSLRYKQVLFADAWGQDGIRLETVTYDYAFRKGNLVLLPRGIAFTRFKRSYLERVFTRKYQQRL